MPSWHRFSLEASYWFSKALDLGTSYLNSAYERDAYESRSQIEFDVHRDLMGSSRFDQPHAFLLRASYELPPARIAGRWFGALLGGWRLSSVMLFKSGTPITVITGSDAPGMGNVDGERGDRPKLLDPSVLGRTLGNPDTDTQLLPRSAFGFLPIGQLRGNLGRNTFRKGSIRNVNAALSKEWTVSSDKKLSFRAEAINLSNSPQFDSPATSLAEPNFREITNTLNEGRTFRFQLALSF